MNSKIMVSLVSSIVLSTAACMPNLRHCRKLWNANNIRTGRKLVEGEVGCEIENIRINKDSEGDMSSSVKLLERDEGT